jgi:hypothetical protein
MADVLDVDDVLERVLTKGIVIETQDGPVGRSEESVGTSKRLDVPIVGVKLFKGEDDD